MTEGNRLKSGGSFWGSPYVIGLLLVLVLLAGGYLRFSGLNWDASQHLHPDERFLTMVEAAIQPVRSLGQYFDTATSTLNPNNMGFGFFVYGTVPIFIVRYLAEAIGQTGYDQVFLVGRAASAAMDLLAVLLVFLVAQRLFRRGWISLAAAAFYSFAVLPIQLSHYFAVDTFTNTFGLLALYCAVVILTAESEETGRPGDWLRSGWRGIGPYLAFGAAYGAALASKISIAPLVVLLPGAAFIAWTKLGAQERNHQWAVIVRNLALAGILAFLVFRVGQPYAFKGPSVIGILPNEKWIDNLRGLQAQSSGDSDSPPELQWARRPVSFAWDNLVDWGLGLPLGILATVAFAWMAWRIVRGAWREYGLIWAWTGAYFAWQGLSFTRTMRYEIPIYPLLAMLAAWMLSEVWERAGVPVNWIGSSLRRIAWGRWAALLVGVSILAATAAWAYAFTRIYNRPMTRVEASQWIYQNIPGPVNLEIQTGQERLNFPLSYPGEATITNGQSLSLVFTAAASGTAGELDLPAVNLTKSGAGVARLVAELFSLSDPGQPIASGARELTENLQGKPVAIPFNQPPGLVKGQRYGVKFNLAGVLGSASIQNAPVLKVFSLTSQVSLDARNTELRANQPFTTRFTARVDGPVRQLSLPVQLPAESASFQAPVSATVIDSTGKLVGNTNPILDFSPGMDPPAILFDPPVVLSAGSSYLVSIELLNTNQSLRLNGNLVLSILGESLDQTLPKPTHQIRPGSPYQTVFTARAGGNLSAVNLARAVQEDPAAMGTDSLAMTLSDAGGVRILAEANVSIDLKPGQDSRGAPVRFTINQPVPLEKGQTYFLQLSADQGAVALRGSALANESSWDDGLPLRMDGFDGFNGIYQGGLNFEMYWDDNVSKRERFVNTLDAADYVVISSNRQWATTTRVQERYPMTTEYYRALLGCPEDQSILQCYSVAQPGLYTGQLGFELVKVFQSEPALGNWTANTQFAEEAFTVYDHPKVFIFKKSAGFSAQLVKDRLGSVDLSKVIHVTPRKAAVPGNLMMPSELLGKQQEGGTWSELFDRNSLLNALPWAGAVAFYLFILLLGWIVYPFVRLALGGLPDRGYPLARVAGMVLLAFFAWFGGSNGLPFSRPVLWLLIAGLLMVNGLLFFAQRQDILREIKSQPRYYLVVEGLFLAFFLLDLAIRLGNPDLWHPAKGGEKPMDFSYLNAVLKSTVFPPYDPWFAGGTINYYYYGFVLIGAPIKALGILPEVAYNLALPTLFAMLALGAFSIGWNLLSRGQLAGEEEARPLRWLNVARKPFFAGLAAAIGLLILGNLGSINMIWEGFQLLIVPREVMEKADIITRLGWTFQGLARYFGGAQMPYNVGEWYWNPSRAIPGEPITEFPFFTFLYADPHAHLIALPVTVLSLAWSLNILLGKWMWGDGKGERWAWLQFAATFGLGGLAIGALRPTNTWDMPAFLVLGGVAVLYAVFRYARVPRQVVVLLDRVRAFFAEMEGANPPASLETNRPAGWLIKLTGLALPAVALLAGLSFVLYQPFAAWYGQGYNAIDVWNGDHTPMWAYRLHWGVFLFIIVSWMIYETIDWMAKTPLSSLNKLRRYSAFVGGALAALGGAILYLTISSKIQIAWLVLLLGAWALVLIFRPGQPDAKRAALFMVGTALVLTLAVEMVVLRGDLGRMNTVFKFYMQAWTLFSLCAVAALAWLLPAAWRWTSNWSTAWQAALILLVGSAALFPLLGGQAKVTDRMSAQAPHTLDGMTYMAYSHYSDQDVDMNLADDYQAIRWMQDHVQGSPVIVEANTPEYRWGTRFTIYTGLPGVVGWNWHQRQQRALTPPEWVTDRVDQVGQFYTTQSESFVRTFLRNYRVKYIVVGQLERAFYPAGLDKFDRWNGKYWKVVYQQGKTAIYEVLPSW